jgi:hypothetical protein
MAPCGARVHASRVDVWDALRVDCFGDIFTASNREIPALTGWGYNPWRKPGDRLPERNERNLCLT